MDTALRQQQDFEETAKEIRARQEQAKAERQQKVREEELRAAENSGHVVDLFVSDSSGTEVKTDAQTDQRGSAVDVKI